MTPAERQLVTELFDRLATLEDAPRDPEAERAIRDGLRQAPNAVYALVQTVLVQDEALKQRQRPHRGTRGRARRSNRRNAGRFPRQHARQHLGRRSRDSIGAGEPRGSVPNVRPGDAPMGAPPHLAGRDSIQDGDQASIRASRWAVRATRRKARCRRRAAAGRRLVPRHRGGGRGRRDRRLAAAQQHPRNDRRRQRPLRPSARRYRPAAAAARPGAAAAVAAAVTISRARPASTISAAARGSGPFGQSQGMLNEQRRRRQGRRRRHL